VINIRSQKKVWNLPDCERVFFRGSDASGKDIIDFTDRKVKLRGKDEENHDEKGDEYIKLVEEDVQKVKDYGEDENDQKISDLHRGILVIKSEYKEIENTPEKDKDEDKKKEADKKDDDAAGDDEEKKSKTQMVRFIRAYLPQWLKPHDEKRCVYETKLDVKMIAKV
jgi:hypothetical protein